MLTQMQVLSSLLYCAASYALIAWSFRESNKKKSHVVAVMAIVLLFAVKMGHDLQTLPPSHYSVLEVGRHSSTLDIRRSYKALSKRYHPDKNPGDAAAETRFQNIKTSYDVLMDESQRDIFNRFGDSTLEFDPRKDEMKLISDIAVVYLFWIVLGYVMTLPMGARASRTWLMILGVLVLALEVCFCLTETALPEWAPETLTESELLFYCHSLFPLCVAGLRCLSESLYVDCDQTSIAVLKDLHTQQQAMKELLQQLQTLVETDSSSSSRDLSQLESVQHKLVELRDCMENSNDSTTASIEALR